MLCCTLKKERLQTLLYIFWSLFSASAFTSAFDAVILTRTTAERCFFIIEMKWNADHWWYNRNGQSWCIKTIKTNFGQLHEDGLRLLYENSYQARIFGKYCISSVGMTDEQALWKPFQKLISACCCSKIKTTAIILNICINRLPFIIHKNIFKRAKLLILLKMTQKGWCEFCFFFLCEKVDSNWRQKVDSKDSLLKCLAYSQSEFFPQFESWFRLNVNVN